MTPGIYPDLDIDKYHRSEGISKTGLCLLAKAPAVYLYAKEHRDDAPESKALMIGKGLHAAMEGTFGDLYAIGPDAARNTKAWKEFEEKHSRKICLKPDEADPILGMKAAVDAYAPAQRLLSEPGRFEVSYYWIDEATGLLCKCRPDWITADQRTIIDFKTARDATHERFQRAAYDLHYFVSAALTLEGVHKTTGILPERYIFLTIQSTAPHLVAAYEATADEIELGREFIRRNLSLLKRCQDNGTWPGLPEEILPLGLPRWVRVQPDESACTSDDLIAELEEEFSHAIS